MWTWGDDRNADIRSLLVAHLPGYPVHSVVPLGEGQDNVAYEVNGELIVRISKEPDPARRAARVNREACLLAALAGIAPLPIPEPRFTDAERGCLGYFKLPGAPLAEMTLAWRRSHGRSIAARLGALLNALHAVPVDQLADLVGTDHQPLAHWHREAAQMYGTVAEHVPVQHHHPVERFLDALPPGSGYTLAFSHNDLGIEHVLVDIATWRVTGIIDWGDAAIVDPAYDFGLLYRDLGPAALGAAIGSYRSEANDLTALRERATFYARCSVLEDLAYGKETGQDRYVCQSLAAIEWLFPVETLLAR